MRAEESNYFKHHKSLGRLITDIEQVRIAQKRFILP